MAFEMVYADEVEKRKKERAADAKRTADPIGEFMQALRAYGLDVEQVEVSGYGNFKRVASNLGEKRSKNSGWYWLERDGDCYYATYGDWRIGEPVQWRSSNIQLLSPLERQKLDQRIAQTIELNKVRLKKVRDDAAQRAVNLINTLSPAKKHPYLKRKNVAAYGDIKTDGDVLYIPVTIGNAIRSVQKIHKDGSKEFLYDSEISGGYFWISGVSSTDVYFVEGYSTGATVHAATGASVMVCFNSGNLRKVLAHYRKYQKDQPIIIAADNDHHNNDKECGNAGLLAAKKCAKDFSGIKIIYPEGIKGTDWNDAAKELGLESITKTLTDYQPSFQFIRANDLKVTPTNWLIKNYLPSDSIGLLYGASGTMKSFLIFDMALHIAAGKDWHDNKVRDARSVLYVCGEGFNSIAKRFKVWTQFYNLDQLPFEMTQKPVHFLDDDQRFDFIQDLKYHLSKSESKEPPKLIIIDTLNRNWGGESDENSTKDMTKFVDAIDDLRRQTGAMVLVVHHAGKSEVVSARGSSALKAAVDVEYTVSMTNPDEYTAGIQKANIELKCSKMKDSDVPPIMMFEHNSIVIDNLLDEDGDPTRSVVLTPIKGEPTANELLALMNQPLSSAESKTEFGLLATKEAFIRLALGIFRTHGASLFVTISRTELNEQYRQICKNNDYEIEGMRKFRSRAIDRLTELGLVDNPKESEQFFIVRNKQFLDEIIKKI